MFRQRSDKSKIISLVHSLKKAAQGDYSVRVNPCSENPDLILLAGAINQFLEHIEVSYHECKKIEKSLRENEERFRTLFEDSTLGIYRTTPDGEILLVNQAGIRMLGYNSFQELSKRNLEKTGFEPSCARLEFKERLEKEGVIIGLETAWKRKDGSTIFIRESARAIRNNQGKVIYYDGTFEDITEHKNIERQIKQELLEKELLLKEIHHRVKNNLQIICSLLNLQSYKIEDEKAKTAFQYSKNRIYSMALVHEQLYRSNDFSSIQIKPYVDMLIRELDKAYHLSSRVTINQNIDDITLGIDFAIPFGLILNELITNAIKHAFPENMHGIIDVSFNKINEKIHEICVRDNGGGMSEHINIDDVGSLGIHMVKVLIKQIGGELTLKRSPGTTFIIRF